MKQQRLSPTEDAGTGRFDERLRHLPLSRSGDRAPRFKIAVSVSLQVDHATLNCRSINLSRTGILLELSASAMSSRLQASKVVNLTISPDGYYIRSALTISGTVIRVDSAGLGKPTLIAIQFIPQTPKD